MTSPLRTLSRSISKLGRSGSSSRLLTGEKLSLDDVMEIHDDEFTWPVKMKSEEPTGKVERILAVGPEGLRLLVPTTKEELGRYPYAKMKEYTYNAGHKVFQFSWLPSKTVEETIYLTTPKSREIHEMIGKFLTNLLREKKGIKDPEKILSDCTYQRPPELDKMKRGGTQRSYSTPSQKSGVKKVRKTRADSPQKDIKTSSDPTSDAVRRAGSTPISIQPGSVPDKRTKTPKKEESSDDNSTSSDQDDDAKEDNTPKRRPITQSAPNTTLRPKSRAKPKKDDESDEDADKESASSEEPVRKSKTQSSSAKKQNTRPTKEEDGGSARKTRNDEIPRKTPSSPSIRHSSPAQPEQKKRIRNQQD